MLDSLSQGVPAIAVPLTFEQPAIAARLKWVGAGRVIDPRKLNAADLRKMIEELLKSTGERDAAAKVARSILEAGGVVKGADIVEEKLKCSLNAKSG